MAVFHTLAAIGRFIRRTSPPPADLLEAYAHEVIPVLDRAEWLYEHWLEQSTLFTDGEKLGNVAAIHRWETATMGRSLERVIPPSVLADAHERVIEALELASRAAQLLSNGSRYHNANAVCEGQAMLAVSRERRLTALRSMRRHLSRAQATAGPDANAASSEMLEPAWLSAAGSGSGQPETVPDQPDEQRDGQSSSAQGAPATTDGPSEQVDRAGTVANPVDPPSDRPAPAQPAPDTPAPATSARPGRDEGDPPERAGWGSLFASPPDQPDRSRTM